MSVELAAKALPADALTRPHFSALPPLRAKRFGEHAQRMRHAGAELVGLHEHRDERAQVVDARAIGEIAQRLRPPLAGEQLEIHEAELGGQIRIREREFLSHAGERLVEAEAGLDAHDQQVQRIGQRQADAMLAARRSR